MSEITNGAKKLIYMIVDRDPEGRESIDSVYTNKELAEKRLNELKKSVAQPHDYYGPHMDSYEENGGVIDCCIDVDNK